LKNAIDWASDITNPFKGRVAAIFGASTGLVGTLRSQYHLREILAALGVSVLPQPQIFIRSALQAFQPDGSLIDQRIYEQLKLLIKETMKLAASLNKPEKD